MGKNIVCTFLFIFMPCMCIAAEDLELNEAIKRARYEQMMLIDKSQIQDTVKEVKNTYKNDKLDGEQSACEKINPQELLKSQNADIKH